MLDINEGKNMSANQPQTPADAEYQDKLAQATARIDELEQELKRLGAERSQLKTKIVQLEHQLVDAIERSNNPLRTTLVSDEKIRLAEEVKQAWSSQWYAERKRLLDELNRLRSAFESTPNTETGVNEVRDGRANVNSK
jgi:septal ring factor EnvC (AmiA/AmiB activator)